MPRASPWRNGSTRLKRMSLAYQRDYAQGEKILERRTRG